MDAHNICLYKETDKKYTGCNLKTMELRLCTYRGMCSNYVKYGKCFTVFHCIFHLHVGEEDE